LTRHLQQHSGLLHDACQLSWQGIKFYGTIDVGAGYQTNSSRFAPDTGAGVNYSPGKSSLGGKFVLSPDALSGSLISVQIKEPLGTGWAFVGQLVLGSHSYSLGGAAGKVPAQ
jgi:hypothetical protein